MPLKMFDPDGSVTRELGPAWSKSSPPNLAQVLRGVLYVGLELTVGQAFLRELEEGRLRPVAVRAGVGPALFFGRKNARFIAWDPEATDEHADCLVRERPWPFCWGDVVWAVGTWDVQPLFMRWELNEGFDEEDLGTFEIFLGAPTDERPHVLESWLERVVAAEAPLASCPLLPPAFWRKLSPTPRSRR